MKMDKRQMQQIEHLISDRHSQGHTTHPYYPQELKYIKELQLGNVSDEDWPSFSYENEQCDPEDLKKGLFQGIYLFPKLVTSGKPGPASKRKTVVQIVCMTTVTPWAIAYAVVQAHFTLSDKDKWNKFDGKFDHHCFYESIVAMAEGDNDCITLIP
ncbi:hypothetical protein F5148DRAFT_1146280 [Russula earlei]|uniref:Uncharacterized protein n=1 Tax=Russula earlei TaxID=71964 RepID=A0ACC0UKI5_9AGAM|nr:hypothetical protein F5148DRAFT_1146280 [Russula earlei]